jgi:hypothetical protein
LLRGNDQIADATPVAVGQLDLPPRIGAGEAVVPGALIEAADQLTGRGQHDRIEATVSVGLPGVENTVECGGLVADVDASPVQVEAERFGPAVADGEGGGGLGRIGEAMQFTQPDRAMAGFDVTKDAAGPDRSELLIITDQPDTATTADDERDSGVQGEGVGHPDFVDDHQAGPVDAVRPIGQVSVVDGPGELGQRFGSGAGVVAELRRCCGGWGEADHLPAAVGPGLNQGAHGRGLPCACRGDGQLQSRPGGGHGTNQGGLPGV